MRILLAIFLLILPCVAAKGNPKKLDPVVLSKFIIHRLLIWIS